MTRKAFTQLIGFIKDDPILERQLVAATVAVAAVLFEIKESINENTLALQKKRSCENGKQNPNTIR